MRGICLTAVAFPLQNLRLTVRIDPDLYDEIIACLSNGAPSKFLYYPFDIVAYHLDLLCQRNIIRVKQQEETLFNNEEDVAALVSRYEMVENLAADSIDYLASLPNDQS